MVNKILWTLGLFLVFTVPSHAESPQLDTLATTMVGYNVHVVCGETTHPGLVGWVFFDQPTLIHINGGYCGIIDNAIRRSPATIRYLRHFDNAAMLGAAMSTLLHESTHLRLESADEGLVECMAYRNVWPYVKALNLPTSITKDVMEGVLDDHIGLPDNFRTYC